jgi:hypothetical protein
MGAQQGARAPPAAGARRRVRRRPGRRVIRSCARPPQVSSKTT